MTSVAGKDKNLKKWKNRKIPKITYENFLPFFPIPADSYTKMILMGGLHSRTVKKKTKKLHLQAENGPRKCLFQVSYIRAFGRIEYYMKWLLSELEGGRKWWPKITSPSTKRGKYAPAGGHSPAINKKKYNSSRKRSKIQKTEKIRNLLMKFFFPSPRPRPDHTPKYSP